MLKRYCVSHFLSLRAISVSKPLLCQAGRKFNCHHFGLPGRFYVVLRLGKCPWGFGHCYFSDVPCPCPCRFPKLWPFLLPPTPHRAGKSAGMTEAESKDQPIPPSPQVSATSPTGLLKSGTCFPVQTLQTSLFLLSLGRGWRCPFSRDTLLLSCSKTPHHGLNKVPSVLYTMRPILELQTGLPTRVPPIVFPTSVNGLFIPSCTLQKRKPLFLYSMFTPL